MEAPVPESTKTSQSLEAQSLLHRMIPVTQKPQGPARVTQVSGIARAVAQGFWAFFSREGQSTSMCLALSWVLGQSLKMTGSHRDASINLSQHRGCSHAKLLLLSCICHSVPITVPAQCLAWAQSRP